MGSWSVVCAACRLQWVRTGRCSEYERQAMESRPCPGCGAYTLVCGDPKPAGHAHADRRAGSRLRAAA